ncbi:MAG: YqgE/AlgH family protein [Nitrospirae bacterium]|nr:YqgE/AlgH family protein [Nitrospirota bacterium]
MMLVAMPTLLDPNFRQTVVLLCEHGADGSMGLVLNRPTAIRLTSILPEAERLRGLADPVYAGGPVQTNALMILYRGEPTPAAHPVLEDLYLTGDLQMIESPDRYLGAEPRARFYLGYAGWAAGQLEMELSAGGWKLMPGDSNIVFQPDPLRVWPKIMQTLGQEWAVYADMPSDPRLN